MLDPVNETTGAKLAKRDSSAGRLWTTQRTQVNPWDERAPSHESAQERDEPKENSAQGVSPALATPMISQEDTLAIEGGREQEVFNPFERLIEHQLHLRLPPSGDDDS